MKRFDDPYYDPELAFEFIDSLSRSCKKKKYIRSITFDITRYGEHIMTLGFEHPLSERQAIREVEKWLSQPLDVEYCTMVGYGLAYNPNYTYHCSAANIRKSIRGDLIGAAKFLEKIRVDSGDKSHVYLECGS